MSKPVLCLLFIVTAFSCTITENKPAEIVLPKNAYSGPDAMISEGKSMLKEGDLLVRTGIELSSQMIRQLNRIDQKYSHSGIVFFDGRVPYVYHIVTGDENPDGKLKKDSIASFCNPRKNSGFAVYRYDIDEKEMKDLKQQIYKWHEKGVQFDSLFSLKTDEKMYCSEMIKKGLERSTNGRISIPTMRANEREAAFFSRYVHLTPEQIIRLDLVTVDQLYTRPECRLIKSFEYNPKP
jgi:hypothetical protein